MSENMKARLDLIEEIERERESKVITYFCGDRPGALSQISSDAIRPMYDHLKSLGHVKQLDLYIYSRGGVLEVPWRMVTMLRGFCDVFSVIIPYKAYSATSLISLGADKCTMGEKGELSPIDPQLQIRALPGSQPIQMPKVIGVEDIYAYLRFIKEKAGLTDQEALSEQVGIITEKITPVVLGKIQRAYSHIRLIARKLLSLQKPPLEETKIAAIIDALTEKIYIHGHGIGRQEAKEMGLPIDIPDESLENKIWSLYLNYEEEMKLASTADLSWYIREDETQTYTEENVDYAFIESSEMSHAFRGNLEIKMLRNVPPNPSLNLNLSLQMPPDINLQSLPQNISQVLGQIIQQAGPQIADMVKSEIARQSPIIGASSKIRFAKWISLR